MRSTNQTPPLQAGAMASPSSMARRVLPIPPGPTRVTARPGSTSSAISTLLAPAADEGVGRAAQVVPVSWHGADRRHLVLRAAAHGVHAPQLDRAVEVTQAEDAETVEADAGSVPRRGGDRGG